MAFTAARLATGIVFAVILVVWVLCAFDPLLPQPGLDASWVTVMGEASAIPRRWGIDLAFTYGPAEPLALTYYNLQYVSHTIPLLVAISACHGLCSASLLVEPLRRGRALSAAGLVLCFILFVIIAGQYGRDFVFLSLPLAVALLQAARRDRLQDVALHAAVFALGVIALIKTSFALASLPLLALIDLRALAGRRLPCALAIFGLGFLAAFLFYGQHVGDLPAYLTRQFSVAAGYSAAMSSAFGVGNLKSFMKYGMILIATAILAESALGRSTIGIADRLFLPVCLAAYVFVLMKAGFVRDDAGHELNAFAGLGIGVLFYASRLLAEGDRLRRLPGVAGLVLCLALVVQPLPLPSGHRYDAKLLYRYLKDEIRPNFRRRFRLAAAAVTDFGTFQANLDRAKQGAWQDIKADRGLPNLSGTVDVIQSEQSSILAGGLDYHPRPSFQEYSTYTAALIAANLAFFEGPSAPEWIIFAPGSIDDRDPASAEGAAWPDFLRLYRPWRWVNNALALQRRPKPLAELLAPAVVRHVALGKDLRLETPGLIFARIHVRSTFLGRLADALFRPPPLSLNLSLRNGEEKHYRLIAAQAEAGFVLSPAILDPIAYAKAATGSLSTLEDLAVVALNVATPSSPLPFYATDVEIDLQTIDTSVLKEAEGNRRLSEILDPSALWADLTANAASPLDGNRLSAPAPSHLTFPVVGRRILRFGYGLLDDAWATDQTQGACFAIEPRPAGRPLWQNCLDPLAHEADRGQFTAEVALPPGTDAVTLTTSCRQDDCTAPAAFWSGVSAD